ncbi:MAG: hypothetical protein WD031_03475, partial [Gemmatimonadota bacterium]
MHLIRSSALTIIFALVPTFLPAQEVEGVRLGLRYQPEYQPGLVVLPFAGAADQGRVLEPVRGIIRQDLDFSDRFEMLEAGVGVAVDDSVNLDLWNERGADWVLQGELGPDPAGGSQLRLVLHDAVYGTIRGDETFLLPAQGDPTFRMSVHAVSDEIVRWATGEAGAAATRIAFVLEGRGSKELFVIDYDGENVQQLTNDGSIALSPAWSPEAGRIAYTSYRSGSPLLYERDLGARRDRLMS